MPYLSFVSWGFWFKFIIKRRISHTSNIIYFKTISHSYFSNLLFEYLNVLYTHKYVLKFRLIIYTCQYIDMFYLFVSLGFFLTMACVKLMSHKSFTAYISNRSWFNLFIYLIVNYLKWSFFVSRNFSDSVDENL